MIEYFGFLAPCVFAVLWAVSALSDSEWRFGVDYISDLGVSKKRTAAIAFNGGCLISGTIFLLYSVWMVGISDNLLVAVTFVCGIIMSIFFSLIGIIDEHKRPYHKYIAYCLFLTAMMFLVFLLYADVINGRYLLSLIILAGFVAVLFSSKVGRRPLPMAEAVGAIAIAIVLIAHTV